MCVLLLVCMARGKYNDGFNGNFPVLAQRLANGMKHTWESQTKHAISAEKVKRTMEPVAMPLCGTLVPDDLLAKLRNESLQVPDRVRAGRDPAFVSRTRGTPGGKGAHQWHAEIAGGAALSISAGSP